MRLPRSRARPVTRSPRRPSPHGRRSRRTRRRRGARWRTAPSPPPDPGGTPVAEIPVARVSTPVLPGTGHIVEVWRCNRPATSGQRPRVRFRRTAEMLFGCIAVSEAELAPGAADPVHGARCGPGAPGAAHRALHEATTQAYREICATGD